MFGGQANDNTLLQDLWSFNTVSGAWTLLPKVRVPVSVVMAKAPLIVVPLLQTARGRQKAEGPSPPHLVI